MFNKKCSSCDDIIYLKNKVSLDESIRKNSKCKKCVLKETSIRQIKAGGNKGMMIEKYGKN